MRRLYISDTRQRNALENEKATRGALLPEVRIQTLQACYIDLGTTVSVVTVGSSFLVEFFAGSVRCGQTSMKSFRTSTLRTDRQKAYPSKRLGVTVGEISKVKVRLCGVTRREYMKSKITQMYLAEGVTATG